MTGDEIVPVKAVQNGLGLFISQQTADDALVVGLIIAGIAVKIRDPGIHNDFLLTDGRLSSLSEEKPVIG